MIIDDSALVRQALNHIFSTGDEFEVIGMANDPYDAVQQLKKDVPDVITLDVEMPKMDGITFLGKLMKQHPIPVVVISTLTKKGTNAALKALEYGAVEVMHKPNVSTGYELDRNASYIRTAVRSASHANKRLLARGRLKASPAQDTGKRSAVLDYGKVPKQAKRLLAIGASTGGTEAIRVILKKLHSESPGTVIVQHMPGMFTGQFAERLNMDCDISVKEAVDGDRVLPGHALIAPGNQHMVLKKDLKGFYVELNEHEEVNRHRPSVDVLFHSVAHVAGVKATGALLTGMGKDGARGLLAMREAGAFTIAQDESSSVVFGMPKEAVRLEAATKVLSIEQVGQYLSTIKNENSGYDE